MKFAKYENYWYEYDESTPIDNAILWNRYGGRMSGVNLSKLEIVEADDFDKLNWAETELYSDKYATGWLDKKGNFYGCTSKNHKEQAVMVHGTTEEELEKQLFIKIAYIDRLQKELSAIVCRFDGKFNQISREQLEFLKKHPINNYDEIEYIYRMQLQRKIEEEQNKKKNKNTELDENENQPGM